MLARTNGGETMKSLKKIISNYKKDIFLIGAFLVLGGGLLAYTYLGKQDSAWVSVRVNGICVKIFSLEDTVTYDIEGEGGTNVLHIDNGMAWLSKADCPDQICVNTGKIKYVGQSIICLPHKVVVEIKEAEDAK